MSESRQRQAGETRRGKIEITKEMIVAGAEILEASAFCGTSQGIAEDLAEEILQRALGLEFDQSQNK
jgi:hypothetical protein